MAENYLHPEWAAEHHLLHEWAAENYLHPEWAAEHHLLHEWVAENYLHPEWAAEHHLLHDWVAENYLHPEWAAEHHMLHGQYGQNSKTIKFKEKQKIIFNPTKGSLSWSVIILCSSKVGDTMCWTPI